MSKQLLNAAHDDRDALDLLKAELEFLEKGGYGRSVRTPWLPTSVFQDSTSCFCFPDHDHDNTCVLMQFVPPERREECVPCHHIPLNEAGDTVEELERKGSQRKIEELIKVWLRTKILQLERERAVRVAVV